MKNIFSTLFALFVVIGLNAQTVERIEPSNWWIGMEHSRIQVLVYGDNISSLRPEINYPGLKLEKSIAVDNPNYLFLYLNISDNAEAGTAKIDFYKGKKQKFSEDFILEHRKEGAAMVQGFTPSDVIYLITPDRFANGNIENDEVDGMKEGIDREFNGGRHGGDIAGMSENLDYIDDLGFTAVWLNPIIENDMHTYSYHGYAATDFYSIDRRYGNNEEFRAFCKDASDRGIKVIMDMIMNHCGSEHWFVLDPPMNDWINNQDNFTPTSHKRQTVQDIYASEYDKAAFSDGWFVETMPDLNQKNELMADYLIINTLWWIEYSGISAIRMDTYPYPDKNFMSQWTCAVMSEYPNFNIVGEEWSVNPAIVSYWQRDKVNHDGYSSCLPSVMDFPLQDALVKGLTQEENWNSGLVTLYEMLANDFLYAHPEDLVIFPDNHDMSRFYTQIGNDMDLYKMGMIYFSTMRGVPQFYYGTEILMNDNENPGDHGLIRTDFPGGWEGDTVNAFTGEGLTPDQKEAQSYTKELLNWRKNEPLIHNGALMQFAPEHGVYAYFRYDSDRAVMVLFNKNSETTEHDLQKYAEMIGNTTNGVDVLTKQSIDLSKTITLKSKSAMIVEFDR